MISDRAKRVGLKELAIFDYFEIDRNLPKHKKDKDDYENSKMSFDGATPSEAWVTVPTNNPMGGTLWINGREIKAPLKERFISWLYKKLTKSHTTREEEKPTKKITVVEFFTQLSKSYKELTPIAEIAKHYENAIVQANVMGQQALVQKFKDLMDAVRGEAHLIAMGLKKYVTEEQVVKFYGEVGEDKNLKLTWIKNFSRIIPEDVYLVKKDVDERKIFDNYVVLHYDPENNGEKLTKEEIEKKKDPILFGVIKNSRKLYYIADWKDEYCDLTLEEMFKILGEKVLNINNKTVKTFIDKTKV
jgi:hypothetical protein